VVCSFTGTRKSCSVGQKKITPPRRRELAWPRCGSDRDVHDRVSSALALGVWLGFRTAASRVSVPVAMLLA